MPKAQKPKARALVAVPQSREEAVRQLGRIGTLRRQIEGHRASGGDRLKTIAEEIDAMIAPLQEQLAAEEQGLHTWCEAHRADLTGGGKVKFAELGTGTVKWRARPPKVGIRGVDIVIEGIKRLNLMRFLRVKEEINREAMLAEPDLARTLQGVTISSEGEDFEIVPAELEIADRQVA